MKTYQEGKEWVFFTEVPSEDLEKTEGDEKYPRYRRSMSIVWIILKIILRRRKKKITRWVENLTGKLTKERFTK